MRRSAHEDPDARLHERSGREAVGAFLGHVPMEQVSLIVKTMVTPADGHGERDAAWW
jgi:hypothetical protein